MKYRNVRSKTTQTWDWDTTTGIVNQHKTR